MLTILFSMTIREGMEAEFVELARAMMRSTHERDDGCIAYTIHAKDGAPREFVLYEQWLTRRRWRSICSGCGRRWGGSGSSCSSRRRRRCG